MAGARERTRGRIQKILNGLDVEVFHALLGDALHVRHVFEHRGIHAKQLEPAIVRQSLFALAPRQQMRPLIRKCVRAEHAQIAHP